MRYFTLALGAGLLSACTTSLETNHIPPDLARSPSFGNFTYVLPKTSFVVAGTITLNGCDAVKSDAGGYQPSLDLTETFAVTPFVEADADAQYAIPYDKLQTWMKETQVTVTSNPNKTFGGFNATINDQAGPVAMAGILAAVKIAGGLGVPSVPRSHLYEEQVSGHLKGILSRRFGTEEKPDFCKPEVLKALQQIDADNKAIYSETAEDTDKKHTIPNPDIAKQQSEVGRLRRDYKLTRTFTFTWSPTLQSGRPDGEFDVFARPIDIYASFISNWLSSEGTTWYARNSGAAGVDAVKDPVVVQLAVRNWTMGATRADAPDVPVIPPATGVVLRDPALAELRLCRGACASESTLQPSTDIATPTGVSVPQFGRYVVLPLTNGLFQNSNLVVALNPDGSIASLGNHSTGTLAAGLGVAGQIGDQFATSAKARNDAMAAANAAAATSAAAVDVANKTLADCLTQQAAIKAAGGTPIGSCQ